MHDATHIYSAGAIGIDTRMYILSISVLGVVLHVSVNVAWQNPRRKL